MKDKAMSRKHDRHSHKRHDVQESDDYKHVLKERHYKDDERNKKKDRDKVSETKHSSHSHKRKRSNSPHHNSHRNHSLQLKSIVHADISNAHRKQEEEDSEMNESYEELSRRKRKLESELRALDLEEAAAKEAENKKARRENQDKNRKPREVSDPKQKKNLDVKNKRGPDVKVKLEPRAKIKHEPVSDDERNIARNSSKNDNRHSDNRNENSHFENRNKNRHSESRNESRHSENKGERPRTHFENRSDNRHSENRSESFWSDNRKEHSRSDNRSGNPRFEHKNENRHTANKNGNRHSENKVEKDRHKKEKPQTSKSSDDEKNWGQPSQPNKKKLDKEKPNFETSGKLAEETNTYNGVVIKYNEPSEARKPKRRWRLYPFKGDSDLPFIPIHRQSAYLFGRTRLIADIPIDHPSCSKQHAVLQFRLVPYQRDDGTTGRRVRPYIIDLESSNGTFVNNNKIDPRKYVELVEKDVVKFGYSSREYVLLHEESKVGGEDDDVLEMSD